MRPIHYLLLCCLLTFAFIGCKKDNDGPIEIELSITDETINLNFADSLVITATVRNGKALHVWNVEGIQVSNSERFAYHFPTMGTYTVDYIGAYSGGKVTKKYTVVVGDVAHPANGNSSKYLNKIFEYVPAPGQFINETGLGLPAGAANLVGGINGMVSLGGYGGYIVFGFDHSIVNKAGYDFALYGNPLPPPTDWSEPGIVMVSQDVNKNGLPDDAWYELAGSEYNHATTRKNYTITYYNPKGIADVRWKSSLGDSGVVLTNTFHSHNYYPEFIANQDSVSFTGTLLRNTFTLMENSSIYINPGFSEGYADNWGAGDDYTNKRYNSFDISKAVNAAGKAVPMNSIDFVKVYTGQNDKGNTLLGEISCEFRGAEDLSIK